MLTSPTITRVDRPGGRHYRVEGYEDLFPSVTTVLKVISKPALIRWSRDVALESVRAALSHETGSMTLVTPDWIEQIISDARRRPDEQRDQAADFGSQAHLLIDEIIQGKEPEIPQNMVPVVTGFEKWRQDAGLQITVTEKMVYSAKYGYAGSMDAVAYRGSRLVALDWKTSNGLYPENALQVAAYAKALEEMSGEQVQEVWVVRFGKSTPEFEARQVLDLETAFTTFRAALYLWKAIQGRLI